MPCSVLQKVVIPPSMAHGKAKNCAFLSTPYPVSLQDVTTGHNTTHQHGHLPSAKGTRWGRKPWLPTASPRANFQRRPKPHGERSSKADVQSSGTMRRPPQCYMLPPKRKRFSKQTRSANEIKRAPYFVTLYKYPSPSYSDASTRNCIDPAQDRPTGHLGVSEIKKSSHTCCYLLRPRVAWPCEWRSERILLWRQFIAKW